MSGRPIQFVAALGISALACAAAAEAGTASTVTFTTTSPLSGNAEMARRMLSPLGAAALPQLLDRAGAVMSAQPLDPAKESFVLFVPSAMPESGYGLIVFVPPWNGARIPGGWASALDAHGFLFVSAAQGGNDASVLGRRMPLALIAEQNIAARYKLDPDKILITGFSGGSRVALRLALAYPDIFRGAILDEGSDPIGTATIPIPPKDLFLQFQNASRLLYIADENDAMSLRMDVASKNSLREWCVFGAQEQVTSSAGHDVADGESFANALDALLAAAAPDPRRTDACRADLDNQMQAKLQQAEQLIAGGQRDAAHDLLKAIDAQYGGLAAPKSVELMGK